mgnify:CR=1 FL=1|jgi:hypothetical protein
MADRSDISSEDLKKRWLSDADKREKNGDKAGANKMRAMAERPLLWRKTERELRRSAASHQGSFDWSAIFATLLPILIEKLKEWLTKK